MTINNALDSVLELKGKLRDKREKIDDLHNLSDELLNMKIDLGGRSELSDDIFLTQNRCAEVTTIARVAAGSSWSYEIRYTINLCYFPKYL